MSGGQRPAVSRRRLRNELRKLRLNAYKTQREVAESLDWSPMKMLRIENGQVGVSTTDLRALLASYGVTDAAEIERLSDLARMSRLRTLSNSYSDTLSRAFAEFLENEEAASLVRHYETRLIPGPLQTDEYARVILQNYVGGDVSAEVIEGRVNARLERKELYIQEGGPQAYFIIDEAALWRRVGAESGHSRIMVDQLHHLIEMAEHPNISIQIVPFHLGAYRAMETSFVVLEFEDPAEDDVLYLEEHNSMIVHDSPERILPFLQIFWDLENAATEPHDLSRVIEGVISQFQAQSFGIPDHRVSQQDRMSQGSSEPSQ
jgi:transcriptional regulator with XRE-family HTH domain